MSLLEFGNFADGDFSEFADSSGANYSGSTGRTVISASGQGPNGGRYARLTTDDNSHLYGDTTNVRIHLIGFPAPKPVWFNQQREVWRAVSMRVPAGFTSTQFVYAGDEVHGDNGTGPAPLNISFQRGTGGLWEIFIRGGARTDGNYDSQWAFGNRVGGTTGNRADWAGGNKQVVLDEWIHFRFGWFLATDTSGWFEAWARWDGLADWRNIVPRKTGIPTCYPDKNGDGFAATVMMSLYYLAGAGGTNAIDYAAGAWADNQQELADWQDARLGFTAETDTTPPALSSLLAFSPKIGLSFNEHIDPASVPVSGDFAVTVNGSPVAVTAVSQDGPALLNLTIPAFISTDAIHLVYTPGSTPIKDLSGNEMPGFSQNVSNITPPANQNPTGTLFGKSTVGANWLGNLDGYKRASRFTLSEDGTVTAVGHYVKGGGTASDTGTIRLLIYAADGVAGAPGTLKATAAEYTIAGDAAAGWREQQVSPGVALAAGDYWLGEQYTGVDNAYMTADDGVANAQQLRIDGYADGPSDPWDASEGGGFTGVYDRQFSIYARYTPSGLSTGRPSATRAATARTPVARTPVSRSGV